MGEGGEHGDVGARFQFEVIVGTDMRRVHEINFPWVNDNEFGALADALLHAGAEHRVAIGGVGTHDQNDIAIFNGLKSLRPR